MLHKFFLFSLVYAGLIFAAPTPYACTLKLHCHQSGEDRVLTFAYVAGLEKPEFKNVELGTVKARIYGPSHYLSLYLFDNRTAKAPWTKTHSNSLPVDLEVSLVLPESDEHTLVANLRCVKQAD